MPKPTRIIHAPQLMDALMDTLRSYLSFEMQHTRIPPEVVLKVLAYASVNGLTLEASCARLEQAPYHGQPYADPDEVMRGNAKAGTTHFHGYLTVSVAHTERRHVLAVLFVHRHDSMADLVKRALKLVKRLKIRIRRVLLDAGFCAVEVFRTVDRRHLSYIIPLKVRSKSAGGAIAQPTPCAANAQARTPSGRSWWCATSATACAASRMPWRA